jgi:hypothetical protein
VVVLDLGRRENDSVLDVVGLIVEQNRHRLH